MTDIDTTAIAKPGSLDRWLAETGEMLDKLGVPASVVRSLPAIVALFGVTGLPAAFQTTAQEALDES